MIQRNILMMVIAAVFVLVSFGGDAQGAQKAKLWPKLCASCHDGKTAPGPEELRASFKTVDDFTAAVKAKGAPCMNIVKNDEKMIRRIAAEIGIRNGKK